MQDPCCFICGPDGELPPGRRLSRTATWTHSWTQPVLCHLRRGCGSLLEWPGRAFPSRAHSDTGHGLSALHSHLAQYLKGSRWHSLACTEDLLRTPMNTQIHRHSSPHTERCCFCHLSDSSCSQDRIYASYREFFFLL